MLLNPNQDDFTPEDSEFLRHLAYRKLCASQYRAAYLIYAILAQVEPYNPDFYCGQIYCLVHDNDPGYYDHATQLINHCRQLEMGDETRRILDICALRLKHNQNKKPNNILQ